METCGDTIWQGSMWNLLQWFSLRMCLFTGDSCPVGKIWGYDAWWDGWGCKNEASAGMLHPESRVQTFPIPPAMKGIHSCQRIWSSILWTPILFVIFTQVPGTVCIVEFNASPRVGYTLARQHAQEIIRFYQQTQQFMQNSQQNRPLIWPLCPHRFDTWQFWGSR